MVGSLRLQHCSGLPGPAPTQLVGERDRVPSPADDQGKKKQLIRLIELLLATQHRKD